MSRDNGCGCNMNHSTCNVCGQSPCRCNTKQGIISFQPVPNTPTITIESLLKLIEAKCDKETCRQLQFELDLLYGLLQIPKPKYPAVFPPSTPPGMIPKVPPVNGGSGPLPPLAFQLISNMVESLNGNIKNKYPSAELLKQQLTALWKCVYDKQQHHGEWKDNFTYRDVNSSDSKCLLDGSKDYAPSKIKVVTPVDVGSTVFNTVDGKNCLFESLVDNNTVEPTKLSVLEGLWMNYCDIKDVINCVLPRRIITDCHENCDDPNHDGVFEDEKLCDCVICKVVDTYSVDLTKTKLPKGIGNSIKADVRLDPNSKNLLSITPQGLLATATPQVAEQLPVGAVTMISKVSGSVDVPLNDTPDYKDINVPAGTSKWYYYEFGHESILLKASDYALLKKTGEKVVVTFNASVGYYIGNSKSSASEQVNPYQWGTVLYVDGKRVKSAGDMYSCNRLGDSSGLADNGSLTITTTGHDIKITVGYVAAVSTADPSTMTGATFSYDMASFTVSFAAGDNGNLVPFKETNFPVPAP